MSLIRTHLGSSGLCEALVPFRHPGFGVELEGSLCYRLSELGPLCQVLVEITISISPQRRLGFLLFVLCTPGPIG